MSGFDDRALEVQAAAIADLRKLALVDLALATVPRVRRLKIEIEPG